MPENSLAVEAALQNIRSQSASGRKVIRQPAMPPVWRYPLASEREYAVKIGKLMQPYFAVVEAELLRYQQWAQEFKGDAVRNDGFTDEWSKTLEKLRDVQKKMFEERGGAEVYSMVSGIGTNVTQFNFKQWTAYLSRLAGQPFFPPGEAWVASTVDTWSDLNFELIRSLSDDYIKQVNTKVVDAITSGTTQADLAKTIRKLNNTISKSRANLIARDQVGKLNGDLTRRRQSDAGVAEYTWRTAMDERVRSTHSAMSGKMCEWKDPTKYKVEGQWRDRSGAMTQRHPGIDIQCRCYASPNMDAVWAEAEKIAEKEGWFTGAPQQPARPARVPKSTPVAPRPVAEPAAAKAEQPVSFRVPENRTAFAGAPLWLQKAIAKAESTFQGKLPDTIGQDAYYNPNLRRIHMGPKYKSGSTNFQEVWRHEFGHHTDFASGGKDYRGRAQFTSYSWSEKMTRRYEAMKSQTGKMPSLSSVEAKQAIREKHGKDTDDVLALFSELKGPMSELQRHYAAGDFVKFAEAIAGGPAESKQQRSMLADCFAAISKGKIGWGHEVSYWRQEGQSGTELFAQFTALTSHPKYGNAWSIVLREIFTDLYEGWVRAVTKYGATP